MATWHTPETARLWLAGTDLDDALLEVLLEVAKSEVLAFAPALAEADANTPPVSYVYAQIQHAQNKLNASRVGPGGDVGDGTFALSPFPLDWSIRQTLRPKRGIPRVG